MSDDGPLLVRPVPRRPFTLSRQSATPTDDEPSTPDTHSAAGSHGLSSMGTTASPGLHSHLTAALAAWDKNSNSEQASPAISRPASLMNLTSSTLYGIYSPTAGTSSLGRDRDEPQESPWGMGAQTPIRRPDIDDATFELMRERSHLNRRRSSYKGAEIPRVPPHVSSIQMALRTALLFMLGLGYGALVTRLHEQQGAAATADGLLEPGFNSKYLGAWGVAGVVLGSLLPWFDGVWEARFGAGDEDVAVTDGDNAPDKALDTSLDWALVMRAIGAFVGIVFAIVSRPSHTTGICQPMLTSVAQTLLVFDAPSLRHPRPGQPAALVAHRPLQAWLSALRRRWPGRLPPPAGHQPRHDAHALAAHSPKPGRRQRHGRPASYRRVGHASRDD